MKKFIFCMVMLLPYVLVGGKKRTLRRIPFSHIALTKPVCRNVITSKIAINVAGYYAVQNRIVLSHNALAVKVRILY